MPVTGLLVSVRSASEARAALDGGAAIVDVKEPANGPLGRATDECIRDVLRTVAGRTAVSAALGELVERRPPYDGPGLAYAKWGLAGCGADPGWRAALLAGARRLRAVSPACEPVAVAYADWQTAGAPPPTAVLQFAQSSGWRIYLIDTWTKDGRNLLDHISAAGLAILRDRCRSAEIRMAVAGSLGPGQIRALRPLAPDWFAVRGAACRGSDRSAAVDRRRVERLARSITGDCRTPRFGNSPTRPAERGPGRRPPERSQSTGQPGRARPRS